MSFLSANRDYQWHLLVHIVVLLLSVNLLSCGEEEYTSDGQTYSSDTGSYSFSLNWPDGTFMKESSHTTSRAVDCSAEGIETIVASFYTSSGTLIKSPSDEFQCVVHSGRVSGLTAGSNYRLRVTAEDSSGTALYEGEVTGITIVADETEQGGEIQLSAVTTQNCTDSDEDDYPAESGCGTAVDCDDSDENINPGETEVCNDSKDNDCDGNTDCDDSDCIGDTGCAIDPNADYSNSLGMTFNLISSGTFTMGSPASELGRQDSNETEHEVTLTQNFYMQTTEVTQGQWEAVMGSNPSYFVSCGGNCPVEEVSWDDIQVFLATLNNMNEGTYSLPTEAQWEYAARAGSTTAFTNGDISETGCDYDANLDVMGWYCYNANDATHAVAQKTANAWGLYDMHGNVYEWVADWYIANLGSDPVTDPTGPASGSFRVRRGGGRNSDARYCRSARRANGGPSNSNSYLGFRLLRMP